MSARGRGARYLATRVTVASLQRPRPDAIDTPDCNLSHFVPADVSEGIYIDSTGGMPKRVPDVGKIAARVTCAADEPLTTLTLGYRRGQLAEIRTDPAVPCVEARARELLADIETIGLSATGSEAGILPATPAAWDEATCTFAIPLGER